MPALRRYQRINPHEYANHRGRETSTWARESIVAYVLDVVENGRPSGGTDDDWKREKRRWLDPINDGTQGYIIAWILKLGGYLD